MINKNQKPLNKRKELKILKYCIVLRAKIPYMYLCNDGVFRKRNKYIKTFKTRTEAENEIQKLDSNKFYQVVIL